jgi:RNA-binding protein YhbY
MRQLCCALFLLALVACVSGFAVVRTPSLRSAPRQAAGTVVDGDQIKNLTPIQIKTVRKELSRRRAFNKLVTVYLDEKDDSGNQLQTIAAQLKEHELVQVRGITVNQRKNTKAVTERLALELGVEMNANVFCVEIKGHAATLYCPDATAGTNNNCKPTIQLRTTGKANHWEKRAKAPRDNRGQIVR